MTDPKPVKPPPGTPYRKAPRRARTEQSPPEPARPPKVAAVVQPKPDPGPAYRKSPRLRDLLAATPEPPAPSPRAPRKPHAPKPLPAAAQPRRPRMPEDVPPRGDRPGFGTAPPAPKSGD